MKRIFTFCAAVAMLAACVKEAPKTPVADGYSAPTEDGQVAVQFKSNVVASVESKAQGSLNAWNGNQTIHVYGFQRQKQMDYSNTEYILINNDSANSPQTQPGTISLTQTVDGEEKPYYYQGSATYDFYGYYIDDIVAKPVLTKDGVYLPLVLTGGEDIMIAKAAPEKDAGSKISDYRYAYSAYAARRSVQPTLTFKHQLVQFNFKIESGYSEIQNGIPNPPLIVTGVTIKANNKADLYVAADTTRLGRLGLKNPSGDGELKLRTFDTATGKLRDTLDHYTVPDKGTEGAPTPAAQIGNSLMVIPHAEGTANDSYEIKVHMTYNGVDASCDGVIRFADLAEKVDGQTQFTAGYAYEVTIKVYGLEQVVITATMDEWKAGGKVFIDTDELPEIWDENGTTIKIVERKFNSKDGREFTVKMLEDHEAPVVGDKAVPDGEYPMEDGSTIVITDGTIASITPAQGEDDNTEEPTPTPGESYVINDKDGNEITIYQAEGEALAVGVSASPDGTYVMEDGSTIVITDGKIDSITPAQDEEEGGQNEPQN